MPLLKFDCYAERVVLDCRATRRLTTDGKLTEEVDASVTHVRLCEGKVAARSQRDTGLNFRDQGTV